MRDVCGHNKSCKPAERFTGFASFRKSHLTVPFSDEKIPNIHAEFRPDGVHRRVNWVIFVYSKL
jgi:hypothetical protein